jgi:hypothetical protein
MRVGEVNMKKRISITRTEYSALKEVLKFECGWSQGQHYRKYELQGAGSSMLP